MIDFTKNNLDKASSPYVSYFKDSPIHWQEWSLQTLEYAQQNNKLIFVSIGYSTCHWCHEMARAAFQDSESIKWLNDNCVSIIIDRDQRPDIDHYLMNYTAEAQGSPGWPLNAMLTADLRPFASFTYLPVKAQDELPGFLDTLNDIYNFYQKNKEHIPVYQPAIPQLPQIDPTTIVSMIGQHYDTFNGGFGLSPKFPQHTTLLFMLHYFERTNDQNVYGMLKKTLDSMAMGGLQDHLQGGFFRYCIDAAWTIPHFEKVLYDQALHLWIYSLAYKVLKVPYYKEVAQKIMQCLHESFAHDDDLFYAVLDAETDDKEGASYVWNYKELEQLLAPEELTEFMRTYSITPQGNFDGMNHLIKIRASTLPELEKRLLIARNKKSRPWIDKKIITSWNALTGIGFIMAYRHLGDAQALKQAEKIFSTLLRKHMSNDILSHSSFENKNQKEEFLQDSASLLLLVTYLYEETRDHEEAIATLQTHVQALHHNGVWFESRGKDFNPVPASIADDSIPATSALAEYALLRTALLTHKPHRELGYKQPLLCDFANLAALVADGNFHLISSPDVVPWQELPINCMQRSGTSIKDCLGKKCTEYSSIEELLNALVV